MKIQLPKIILTALLLANSATILAQETAAITTVIANSTLEQNLMLYLPINGPHVPSVIKPLAYHQRIGTFNLRPHKKIVYLTTIYPREYTITVDCGEVERKPPGTITITAYKDKKNGTLKCKMTTSAQ